METTKISENTPLDSLEAKQMPTNPALTWLTWYGIYFLATQIGYSIVLPILTNTITVDGKKLQATYYWFNLLFALGHIAIAAAIVLYVSNKFCRAIFILNIFANLFSLFTITHSLKLLYGF